MSNEERVMAVYADARETWKQSGKAPVLKYAIAINRGLISRWCYSLSDAWADAATVLPRAPVPGAAKAGALAGGAKDFHSRRHDFS